MEFLCAVGLRMPAPAPGQARLRPLERPAPPHAGTPPAVSCGAWAGAAASRAASPTPFPVPKGSSAFGIPSAKGEPKEAAAAPPALDLSSPF